MAPPHTPSVTQQNKATDSSRQPSKPLPRRNQTNQKSKERLADAKRVPNAKDEKLDSIKELTGGRGYFPLKFGKGIHRAIYKNVTLSGLWNWIIGGLMVIGHFYALYYFSQVYERISASEEKTPDFVVYAIPMFFISIVFEVIYDYYYDLGLYRTNDATSSLGSGSVQMLIKKLVDSFWVFIPYVWIYDNFGIKFWLFQSGPIAWWSMFLAVEFGYYWIHRTGHTMHIFWAMHGVHHAGEEYNLTTALRQSIIHGWFNWVFYIPFAFFFPPKLFQLHYQFNLLYQFWLHTQVFGKLGPLEWILVTPSQHRVHHGRNAYCIDKNFGGTLCLFDRLFGTFQEEIEEVPICYGLTHSINTFDPFAPNLLILRNIWNSMKLFDNLPQKLSVLWYGPGWIPGTYPAQEYPIPPATRHTHQKFNPQLSFGLNAYITLEFGVCLALVTFALSYPSHGIYSSYVTLLNFYLLFSLYTFGCLFDRTPNALNLEFTRLSLGALLILYSQTMIQDLVGTRVIQIALLTVVVSAYVINQYRKELAVPLRHFEIGGDYPDAAVEEVKQLRHRRS